MEAGEVHGADGVPEHFARPLDERAFTGAIAADAPPRVRKEQSILHEAALQQSKPPIHQTDQVPETEILFSGRGCPGGAAGSGLTFAEQSYFSFFSARALGGQDGR
jgi:hypothetical protein